MPLYPANPAVLPSEEYTANHTLILSNARKLISMNSGSALTLTVPTNASAPFPVGTEIGVVMSGTGQVDIAPVSGDVTINSKDAHLNLDGQFSAASLTKTATNTWLLVGALIA